MALSNPACKHSLGVLMRKTLRPVRAVMAAKMKEVIAPAAAPRRQRRRVTPVDWTEQITGSTRAAQRASLPNIDHHQVVIGWPTTVTCYELACLGWLPKEVQQPDELKAMGISNQGELEPL